MALLAISFLACFLPSIGLFLWMRGRKADETFKDICNKALVQGMLAALPVIGCSLVLYITEFGLTFVGLSGIAEAAYHDFIVIALSEELSKCLMFHRLLARYQRDWSLTDYVILMTTVGIGFNIVEAIPYAFISNPIVMLIDGITCMHAGYGFIMGYFLAKAKETGDTKWFVIGLALPWLLHGTYDFGLSEEFAALGDATAILSVTLAAVALVTIIVLIVFLVRHGRDDRPVEPPTADAR